MAEKSRRVVVGFVLEGVSGVKQDFKEIQQAVEEFAKGGEDAAVDFAKAFTDIQVGADKIVQKITEGKNVSSRDLAEMRKDYALLSGQIEATFGSLEKAPEGIRKAFETAETQISEALTVMGRVEDATKKAEDRFNSLGKTATESLDGVQTEATQAAAAMGRMSDAVGGEGGALAAAIARVEGNLQSFREELNETGDVGKGEIEKITKAQALLEMEIRKSVGTYDQLDAKSKAAYDKIQQEADEARKTVVELEKANERVEASLDGQIKGFTGFGDAIQQMGGKAGVAAAQMGVLTAAFQQGWQAGQQFNQVIKTDMSEWDEQVELLGMRFKTTFEGIADIVIENGNLLKAVFTGDWEAFKLASDGLRQGLDKTLEGFQKSNDELRKQRDALREAREAAAEKAAEAARLAAEEANAAETSDKLTIAQQKLTAAQKAALEALGASTGATVEAAQAQDEWTSKVVGHIEIQADGTKKYVIGQESVRNATKETQGVVEAAIERTKDANVTTEEQSTVTQKATEAIKEMAGEWKAIDFTSFVKNLGEVDTLLKSIAASAVTAAKAINDFAEAGNDGISVSRADGSDIQPGTLSGGTFRNPGDSRDINL